MKIPPPYVPVAYIACPVTSDPWGCAPRAIACEEWLHRLGWMAYLPQLSVLHEMIAPLPYERWIERSLEMVARCDAVVRLEGESSGADAEVERANLLGIPVLILGHGDMPLAPAGRMIDFFRAAGLSLPSERVLPISVSEPVDAGR